jgi:hypothetical protein
MTGVGLSNTTTRVVAQVHRANASHKVEHSTNLLRPKGYSLPSNAVYLGDVAIALLANLSQPETPEFSQPPGFNEQKWIFSTQSGTLHVHIESHAYWGVGLFNSGYLNVIEITGPHEHRMRLLYDLRASVGRNLWEFKHRSSARKWMVKHCNGATLEGNETTWLEALASAKVAFESSIEILEQRMAVVQKRMQKPHEGSDYVLEKAEVAFTAAELDIGMARKALAEENAPGLERALARAEAALIEADPSTGLLTSEYDASAPLGLTLRADDSPPAIASSDLEIVDLTSPTDEEE